MECFLKRSFRGSLDGWWEWESGMGKGNPRGVQGMIYPPRGNEVPIPHKNFANPNTMYGYEVPIPVDWAHYP